MSSELRKTIGRVAGLFSFAFAFIVVLTFDAAKGGGGDWRSSYVVAARQDDGGDGNDEKSTESDGKEPAAPVVLDVDINKDGEVSFEDFDAIYLAMTSPEEFEKLFGASAGDALQTLDVDGDGEFTDFDLSEFSSQAVIAMSGGAGAGESGGAACVDASPGRRWGAQQPVSPYSTVNLRTGNVLTRIPIVSWLVYGPDMDFALLHNSGQAECTLPSDQNGFNFGPGWNITYGGRLIIGANQIQVVDEDGTIDVFTKSGLNWVAPAGVFDTLERKKIWPRNYFSDPSHAPDLDYWVLTRKNQWARIYDDQGRLLYHTDSNRDTLAQSMTGCPTGLLAYYPRPIAIWNVRDPANNYRICQIFDSTTCRRLDFEYDTSGRVDIIREGDGWERWWRFNYGPSSRLESIEMHRGGSSAPILSSVQITYDPSGRIDHITDPENRLWDYDYDSLARLTMVTDPAPFTTQTQTFTYQPNTPPGSHTTVVKDRRNYNWSTVFNSVGALTSLKNPLNLSRTFQYDLQRNRTHTYDELNRLWLATFDARGNRLTLRDPIGNKWRWEYDSYNNVTSITPPLNSAGQFDESKKVLFIYNDLNSESELADPTHPTQIIEPDNGSGSGLATTTITYFHPPLHQPGQTEYERKSASSGNVEAIVAANGFKTRWEYEVHDGYPTLMVEGAESPLASPENYFPISETYERNKASTIINHTNPFGSFGTEPNDLSQPISLSGCATPLPVETLPADPPNAYVPASPTLADAPRVWPVCNGNTLEWDKVGNLKNSTVPYTFGLTGETWTRIHDYTYDSLDRLRTKSISTTEPTWNEPQPPNNEPIPMVRAFTITPDPNGNTLSVVGPSVTGPTGTTTLSYTYDAANRLQTVSVDSVVQATYDYWATNLLKSVDFANGARTEWTWDNAQRLQTITHKQSGGAAFLTLTYAWSADGLVNSITQTSSYGTHVQSFEYDKRNRLKRESGSTGLPPVSYDLAYTYDQVGNRKTKTDASVTPSRVTTYFYDVDFPGQPGDPPFYNTWSNRLLWSTSTGGATPDESKYYTYNRYGQVKQIVTDRAGDEWNSDLRLYYNRDQSVRMILKSRYRETSPGVFEIDAASKLAREYRYDSPRERYLDRDTYFDTLQPMDEGRWHDYLADNDWSDFGVTVDPQNGIPAATPTAGYQFGVGLAAMNGGGSLSLSSRRFFHADMLGSTRALTDSSGGMGASPVTLAYSAFGERLGGAPPVNSPRYGYAGSHGYQNDDIVDTAAANDIELMHVGARWYDPALGRFLQRDLIGLDGGLNCYAYAHNRPTSVVDPSGLFSLPDLVLTIKGQLDVKMAEFPKLRATMHLAQNVYELIDDVTDYMDIIAMVMDTLDTGDVYKDSKHNNYSAKKGEMYVSVERNGAVSHCHREPKDLGKRWTPIPRKRRPW